MGQILGLASDKGSGESGKVCTGPHSKQEAEREGGIAQTSRNNSQGPEDLPVSPPPPNP